MNDGWAEAVVGRTVSVFSDALRAWNEDSQQHIRDAIAVNVEYIAGSVIRSLPGEPPRRETGALHDSVQGDVTAEGTLQLSSEVTVGTPYALALEHGTSRMLPRPFVAPERERTASEAVGFIGEKLASNL